MARACADAADRRLGILRLNRANNVADRQTQSRQAIGPDPGAHRIVLGAPEYGVAYTRHALDPVEDIDGDVVGQKQRVVAAIRRVEDNGAEERGRLLFYADALALNFLRQARERDLHPVVDVDSVNVGIGTELKRYRQRVAAVIAAHTFHVHHLVDADDLRLNRLGNGRVHDR